MKVLASAPTKVTLFGEHAVVYGFPALVMAIQKRVEVTASKTSDGVVRIELPELSSIGLKLEIRNGEVEIKKVQNALKHASYVVETIKELQKRANQSCGAKIMVKSKLPAGVGLGTSAAVIEAVGLAYSTLLGITMDKKEIAQLAKHVETLVQGKSSGMDASIISQGGIGLFRLENETPVLQRLEAKEIPIVIAYIKKVIPTGEAVARVKAIFEKHKDITKTIFEAICAITEKATRKILENDLNSLGELMNLNHGLLCSLGVSNLRLEQLIHLARDAGALGSKITGAGFGGSIVCLLKNEESAKNVCQVLKPFCDGVFLAKRDNIGAQVQIIGS